MIEEQHHQAAIRQAERKAGRFLATFDIDPDEHVSPLEQLVAAWRRARTLAAALRAMIGETDPDILIEGRVSPVLNPAIEAWQKQEQAAFDMGAALAKLGIEQHRLRIEEASVEALAGVLRATLSDARVGLTIAQQQSALSVFAERLRALDDQPLALGGPPRSARTA